MFVLMFHYIFKSLETVLISNFRLQSTCKFRWQTPYLHVTVTSIWSMYR